MRHLVRHRHDLRRIVRKGGLRHHDLMVAVGEPSHDLGRLLAPRKFAEVLLDVLDLKGTLIERVLSDVIFHVGDGRYAHRSRPAAIIH